MKIVVCIKQVVDTNDIKWTKNNTIDRDGVESVVNPCDLLAIEMALRIKEVYSDVRVIAVSMGPQQAEMALKTAVAMGCDDAILLSDKKFSGADTVATSRTISAAIKTICPDFDLIICGQYATDGDTAQTGPSIAQKLDVEQVTYVSEFKSLDLSNEKKIQVIRKSDEAVEVIESSLPALICVSDLPYTVREISINGYIRAQDYNVKTLNADDIGLLHDDIGIKGSPTWVSKAFRAQSFRQNLVEKVEKLEDAVKILTGLVHEVKEEQEC